ncbi:MAG: hypothetical protein KW788_01040 [Candidatus Doudnabacteria bacterium]|nr:hypothetical protein [Candidatus Doudnabacteria bacterium]
MVAQSCGTLKGSIKVGDSGKRKCLACGDVHESAEQMNETRCPSAGTVSANKTGLAQLPKSESLWL